MMIKKDHCIDVKWSEDKFVILSLYVDNIPLARNDKGFVITIKENLSSNFEMKVMREATYILGVKIEIDW